MSINIRAAHIVLKFEPNISGTDAGTMHRQITLSGLFGVPRKIYGLKASVRVLQSEQPSVTPQIGIFIARGPIGDNTGPGFTMWNSSVDVGVHDIFFHHVFKELPENAPLAILPMAVDMASTDVIHVAATLENLSPSAYTTPFRVHITFWYET